MFVELSQLRNSLDTHKQALCNEVQLIYTVKEYRDTITMRTLLAHGTGWKNLTLIVVSKVSQTEKIAVTENERNVNSSVSAAISWLPGDGRG